jgi:excinuclease ABC subunit C
VKEVRDESHRFAITFHRELRGKAMTTSIIESVPGIGPNRKKALLRHFGTFAKLKEATQEELRDCGVIPPDVADELFVVLRQYEKDNGEQKAATDGQLTEALS